MTALNNTGVFRRQGWRTGTRPTLAVLLALVGSAAAGCSGETSSPRRRAEARKAAAGRAAQLATRPAGPRLVAMPECPAGARPAAAPGGGKGQGTVRVHLESEPAHLHPLRENAASIELVTRGLVYETLLEYRGGAYQPALAQLWEVSEDGLRLTLRLRPGISWHDGRPFTAIDAQATLETVLRSSSPLRLARATLTDVLQVEVLPDRSVRLRLRQPSPIVLRALCEIPIVPERLVRGARSEIARLAREPVGTGPFRFLSWERGQRIRLAAHAAAWRGPPALAELAFEVDPDAARTLDRVRRGELEVLPRLVPEFYPDQIRPPVLGDRVSAQVVEEGRYSLVLINHRRPALREAAVREVLARSWDRRRLAEDVHQGLAVPMGPSPFGVIPELPASEVSPGQRLEQAGFRDADGDGVRERATEILRFGLLQVRGAVTLEREARRFAQQLGRAGIALSVSEVSPADLDARLRAGDFDLAPVEWYGRPDEDARPLFSQAGTYNYGAFHSARVESLLGEVAAAGADTAPQARQRLAAALGEELPVLFLYQHRRVALVSSRAKGLCQEGGVLDLRELAVRP